MQRPDVFRQHRILEHLLVGILHGTNDPLSREPRRQRAGVAALREKVRWKLASELRFERRGELDRRQRIETEQIEGRVPVDRRPPCECSAPRLP